MVIGYTRLYGSYRDDQIDMGTVSAEVEIAEVEKFLKRNNIAYPIAIANSDEVFNSFGVTGIPTLYIIDKQGNITEFEVGGADAEEFKKKIENLLK
jgi:cytochrome c-type biogenesis protein